MIHLEPITATNWRTAVKLKVRPEQEHFVASNLYSIAESQFVYHDDDGTVWKFTPLAIYNHDEHDEMIGFAMYAWEQTHGRECFIARLMIDASHQGQGYGRAVMPLLLAQIEREAGPHANSIAISYEPGNDVARRLYASIGFVETGRIMDGEVVAERPLKRGV